MPITRYTVKKALLAPHTVYKRRRSRDVDPFIRAILEAQYYRPTMYRFIAATAADPDLLLEADLDEDSVVLDVGAYIGEWSEAISRRYGSKIYAFEPVPNAVGMFSARLGGHANVEILPFGLAGSDVQAPLALEGPGSTVRRGRGTFGSAVVQLRDVAAVFEELHLGDIDLCKMNIEGGEYDVFDRLIATAWLPRMRLVSVQFHEWHPKAYARRRAIRRALRRTHEQVWNYPFVWELWRRRADDQRVSAPVREAPVQEA
jgi:FkbM family methyltransferase